MSWAFAGFEEPPCWIDGVKVCYFWVQKTQMVGTFVRYSADIWDEYGQDGGGRKVRFILEDMVIIDQVV